jgi:cysteine desulfuration protein SufE
MLGLNEAVSPLRVRGMGGLLARIKRQLRARSGL